MLEAQQRLPLALLSGEGGAFAGHFAGNIENQWRQSRWIHDARTVSSITDRLRSDDSSSSPLVGKTVYVVERRRSLNDLMDVRRRPELIAASKKTACPIRKSPDEGGARARVFAAPPRHEAETPVGGEDVAAPERPTMWRGPGHLSTGQLLPRPSGDVTSGKSTTSVEESRQESRQESGTSSQRNGGDCDGEDAPRHHYQSSVSEHVVPVEATVAPSLTGTSTVKEGRSVDKTMETPRRFFRRGRSRSYGELSRCQSSPVAGAAAVAPQPQPRLRRCRSLGELSKGLSGSDLSFLSPNRSFRIQKRQSTCGWSIVMEKRQHPSTTQSKKKMSRRHSMGGPCTSTYDPFVHPLHRTEFAIPPYKPEGSSSPLDGCDRDQNDDNVSAATAPVSGVKKKHPRSSSMTLGSLRDDVLSPIVQQARRRRSLSCAPEASSRDRSSSASVASCPVRLSSPSGGGDSGAPPASPPSPPPVDESVIKKSERLRRNVEDCFQGLGRPSPFVGADEVIPTFGYIHQHLKAHLGERNAFSPQQATENVPVTHRMNAPTTALPTHQTASMLPSEPDHAATVGSTEEEQAPVEAAETVHAAEPVRSGCLSFVANYMYCWLPESGNDMLTPTTLCSGSTGVSTGQDYVESGAIAALSTDVGRVFSLLLGSQPQRQPPPSIFPKRMERREAQLLLGSSSRFVTESLGSSSRFVTESLLNWLPVGNSIRRGLLEDDDTAQSKIARWKERADGDGPTTDASTPGDHPPCPNAPAGAPRDISVGMAMM